MGEIIHSLKLTEAGWINSLNENKNSYSNFVIKTFTFEKNRTIPDEWTINRFDGNLNRHPVHIAQSSFTCFNIGAR
jgi:hypothetical protein